MMSTVEIEIIKAGYTPEHILIKDLYFTIDSGKIVGLIGVSGAGKTVAIRAMLNKLPYIEGEMRIYERLGKYSYVPETPSFYEGLTMLDHIKLITSINNELSAEYKQRVNDFIDRLDLTPHLHDFPTGFSKGMKQKLSLLLGLIVKAELYIFDDPFSNLDAKGKYMIIESLKKLKQMGASILIASPSSHMEEHLCDTYIYLHNKTVLLAASHNHLKVKCNEETAERLDCLYHLDMRRHSL